MNKNYIDQLINRFPTWEHFNRNLTRNYDSLIVGSTAAYMSMLNNKTADSNSLNLSIPDQQITMIFEIIKHFFSIVREGGEIVIILSESELKETDKKEILPIHRMILHPWLYPKTKWAIRNMKYPLLLQPVWALRCMGIKIPHIFLNSSKEQNLIMIDEIKRFCEERTLQFQLNII